MLASLILQRHRLELLSRRPSPRPRRRRPSPPEPRDLSEPCDRCIVSTSNTPLSAITRGRRCPGAPLLPSPTCLGPPGIHSRPPPRRNGKHRPDLLVLAVPCTRQVPPLTALPRDALPPSVGRRQRKPRRRVDLLPTCLARLDILQDWPDPSSRARVRPSAPSAARRSPTRPRRRQPPLHPLLRATEDATRPCCVDRSQRPWPSFSGRVGHQQAGPAPPFQPPSPSRAGQGPLGEATPQRPSSCFFPLLGFLFTFGPCDVFFRICEFSYYPRIYCFAEKSLVFMHIITHQPCIGLK